jgi:hypothetical protein
MVGALTCAVVLAGWIGVLAVTLPRHYTAGGWRLTWIGFDVALLLIFFATAWAAWRRRQILIGCLVVMGALLICDAWFDTTLDLHTRGFILSLLTGLVIELPLAVAALAGARQLLRLTIGRLEELEGISGPPRRIWQVPLFGDDSLGYRDVLRQAAGRGEKDPGISPARNGPG